MWNRQVLKANGKGNMKKNYWNSVLVAFIYSLFIGASGVSISNTRSNLSEGENSLNFDDPETATIVMAVLAAMGIGLFIISVLKVLVLNPLNVGCNRFFVVNQNQQAMVGELSYAFKNDYVEALLAMLLSSFLIGLGFILIIPGIILTYSYRMVPYILAQEPHLGVVETLKRSRLMMQGNKWNAFVFDLSFIGWHLLSILTCGLLEIFFVAPYFHNANAALYIAIRDEFDRRMGYGNVVDNQ